MTRPVSTVLSRFLEPKKPSIKVRVGDSHNEFKVLADGFFSLMTVTLMHPALRSFGDGTYVISRKGDVLDRGSTPTSLRTYGFGSGRLQSF